MSDKDNGAQSAETRPDEATMEAAEHPAAAVEAPPPMPRAEMPRAEMPRADTPRAEPRVGTPRTEFPRNGGSPAEVPSPASWIAQARPRPGTGQNRLFELLVQGEDDLVGLLAYALSEQDRHDWLSAWLASHPSPPTEEQVDAYTTGRTLSAQLERYRAGARAALEAYALAAVEFERPLVTEEAVSARIERAARRVEAGGRWWRNIGSALIAIIVLAIVAVAGYALLRYLQIDPVALLNSYLPGAM
jgi:hypothetical protein